MYKLRHSETLVFYDGPELFVAYDQLDTAYVCLLVDLKDEIDKYICVPVSKGRLANLLSGEMDLRQVLESSETGEAYEGRVIQGNLEHFDVRPLSGGDIPEAWLPEEGFFIEGWPVSDTRVVEEAHERNQAVIHWAFRPPEATLEPKITAEHLSQGVKLVQRLLKWAYSLAMRDGDRRVRERMEPAENIALEVYAFSPGSFTLHMQAAAGGDLFGYSEIAKALSILDEVSSSEQDLEDTVAMIARYGGHFATAYKNLLRFIVENETPVSYEWSMPPREDSTRRNIPRRSAQPLYDALVLRVDIGREEKRLVGTLSKVDLDRSTWRLHDDEGSGHNGHWDQTSTVTLGGLVIETQRYEFVCEERLEEEHATGREFTRLYLKSYDTL